LAGNVDVLRDISIGLTMVGANEQESITEAHHRKIRVEFPNWKWETSRTLHENYLDSFLRAPMKQLGTR